jgi:hypothetical protein
VLQVVDRRVRSRQRHHRVGLHDYCAHTSDYRSDARQYP